MNIMNIETIKTIANVSVKYFIPMAAFILSTISFYRTIKISKLEKQLKEYDLRLKQYELERIESSKQMKANVEARIYRISKKAFKIRIANTGNADAYQVDYDIPKEYGIILCKDDGVMPLEVLKAGNCINQNVIIFMDSSKKYEVTTTWKDAYGKDYSSKETKVWD